VEAEKIYLLCLPVPAAALFFFFFGAGEGKYSAGSYDRVPRLLQVWYIVCVAAVLIAQIGLAQTADAEPLMRAPFALMMATGTTCLFAVGGKQADGRRVCPGQRVGPDDVSGVGLRGRRPV
jgi:peptidoglycan/LPS O-acetylase OafA/YrhL